MKVSAKEMFKQGWIITKIMRGLNGVVRIDARRRNLRPDSINYESKWVTKKYANKLALENYNKKVHEFRCYRD
jgi:hypothetical protein